MQNTSSEALRGGVIAKRVAAILKTSPAAPPLAAAEGSPSTPATSCESVGSALLAVFAGST